VGFRFGRRISPLCAVLGVNGKLKGTVPL